MIGKRSKIFRVSSLVSLFLFLAFAATIAVNYSGIKFDYATQYDSSEYELKYENHVDTLGDDICALTTCFVFDSSDSGWNAIDKHDLTGHISNALKRFADQNHTVEFDGYSTSYGAKTTGAFLPVESAEDADLWRAIARFKESYRTGQRDFDRPYGELIQNGVDNLKWVDEGKKVLIFIIGSENPLLVTDKEVANIKADLEEYGITLYIVGLANCGNEYKDLRIFSDNVYEEIAINEVENVVTEIFDKEAYSEIEPIEDVVSVIDIPKPDIDKALREVQIRMYSPEAFSYQITKITTLADGRESITAVCSGKHVPGMSSVAMPDIDIEESSESLKYELSIIPSDSNQNIYIESDYTTADIIYPADKIIKMSLFDWLNNTYGIPARIISSVACITFLAAFLLPIIKRAAKKSKYKKYAIACEVKGEK